MLQAGKLPEAFQKIETFFNSIGIDPDIVDYSKRPKNLPEDINKAWDVLDQSRADYNRISGVTNERDNR